MSTAEAALLQVNDLSKRFGTRVAIAGLSLRVAPGELIALAGPNGSGKSTALRMLAGLLKVDSGDGLVLGRDLRHLNRETRNAIGYLPQRSALYGSLPVYENLRFRAAVAGLRQPAAAARASLSALGLDERANEVLAQFSGGWIRRIEMAATVIHEPRLLLLDEPTNALDSNAAAAIWQQLDQCLAHGAAIVFSTHDHNELSRATRCVALPESSNAH
jgi:ABC-2 type transport system ATP-binding protein